MFDIVFILLQRTMLQRTQTLQRTRRNIMGRRSTRARDFSFH